MTSRMKHTYEYPSLSSKLQRHLNAQRKSGQFCDVTLKVPDAEFHVHRCVFATFSPYFASLPNAGTRAIVELSTLTKEGVEPLVEMMYTSKLTLTEDNIYYVSYAAGYFHIDETAQNCQKFLKELQGKQSNQDIGQTLLGNFSQRGRSGRLSDMSSSSEDHGSRDVVFSSMTQSQEEVTTTQESADTPPQLIDSPEIVIKEEPRDQPEPVAVELWSTDDDVSGRSYPDVAHGAQRDDQATQHGHLTTSPPATYLVPRQDNTIRYQNAMEWHVGGAANLVNSNLANDFTFMNNTGTTERFPCTVCPMSFTKVASLKRHLSTHAGQQPYQCSICSTRFRKISYLKNHMIIHSGEKPFKCNVCSAKFSQRATLFRHRAVHNKERPFQCSVCSMKFNQRSSLVRHMLSHGRDKAFTCTQCRDNFSTEQDLKQHVINVHIGSFPFDPNPADPDLNPNGQDQIPSTSHEKT